MHTILEREAETGQTFQWRDQRNALRQMPRRIPLQIDHPIQGAKEVLLMDLSRKGLRLRTSHNFPCGDTITIFPPEETKLAPLTARIMRVQLTGTIDSPVFEYGVHLTEQARDAGHSWYLTFCYGKIKEHPLEHV